MTIELWMWRTAEAEGMLGVSGCSFDIFIPQSTILSYVDAISNFVDLMQVR